MWCDPEYTGLLRLQTRSRHGRLGECSLGALHYAISTAWSVEQSAAAGVDPLHAFRDLAPATCWAYVASRSAPFQPSPNWPKTPHVRLLGRGGASALDVTLRVAGDLCRALIYPANVHPFRLYPDGPMAEATITAGPGVVEQEARVRTWLLMAARQVMALRPDQNADPMTMLYDIDAVLPLLRDEDQRWREGSASSPVPKSQKSAPRTKKRSRKGVGGAPPIGWGSEEGQRRRAFVNTYNERRAENGATLAMVAADERIDVSDAEAWVRWVRDQLRKRQA